MKQNKISTIAVVMISLVLTGMILPYTQAINQFEEDLKSKASFLNNAFDIAKDTINQSILDLKSKGIPIPPESISTLKEAQNLGNQSTVMNQNGKYLEAVLLATQALQKLKETITSLYRAVNVPQTQQEVNYHKAIQLQSNIDRSRQLIERLENITLSAQKIGINVYQWEQKIAIIKKDLATATLSLKQGNLLQAENQINTAFSSINEITAFFDSLSLTFKTEKISAYINNTEQRLLTLKQDFNTISNQLSISDQTAGSTAIIQAQDSLTRAKTYLNNQQITQTINELETVNNYEKTVTTFITTISSTPSPTPNITANTNETDATIVNSSTATTTSK